MVGQQRCFTEIKPPNYLLHTGIFACLLLFGHLTRVVQILNKLNHQSFGPKYDMIILYDSFSFLQAGYNFC